MGLPGYPQSSSISEIVPNKKPSSYGGPPMTNGSIDSEWLQVAEPERAKARALLCGSFGPRQVEAKAWGPVAPGGSPWKMESSEGFQSMGVTAKWMV